MVDGSVRLDVDLKIDKAERNLDKIIKEIRNAEGSIESKKSSRNSLESRLEAAAKSAVKYREKYEALQADYNRASPSNRRDMKPQLDSAKEQLKGAETYAASLEKELQNTEQEIQKESAQLEMLKAKAGEEAQAIQTMQQRKSEAAAEATRHAAEEAAARQAAIDEEVRAEEEKRAAEEEEERASEHAEKRAERAEKRAEAYQAAIQKIKTGFSKIISLSGRAVKSGAGKVKDMISGSISKGGTDFKSGLKHLLAYGIGLRTVYNLFAKLRSYISDSVKLYAKDNTETQKNINSLKASLQTLKASWGAAFAPIVSFITPALNGLIAMLTRVANAVASLFAALSGKTTFKTAATDASALADATKSAGGAAKEAKKQLMGFDELNILSKDDGGGGGGTGTSYKNAELPDWAEDIAKLIKDGEFVELGRQLANGLWNAINSIDFASLGARFGTILNSIMQVGASFITTFPWQDLGMLIGSFINNAIGNINFYNLGIIIASKLYIALNLAAGLLKSIDWASVTQALLTTIHGIIYGVDWAQLAVDLVEGFKNVFSGATATLINTDWAAEGERLKEVITKFFENVDAASLASDISDFFITLFNSGADLLSGLNGDGETGRKLGDFLTTIIENIDWAGLATSLWSLFSNGISLAAEALSTLAGNLVADLFDALKSAIDSDGDGTISWSEIGKALIDGLAAGIDLIFTKPIEWVRDHIVTPFINGFKEAFGIHSPSTVMKEQGDYIMQGLLDGITDKVQAVIDKFGEIKDGIKTKMDEAKNAVSDAIENIKTFFSNFSLSDIHINMPHFSVQWNAVDSSVARFFGISALPSLVVDWYARGGIVDGATLIGAGEAGKEAIVPLERNTEWINMVADGLIERFTQRSFIDQLVDAFVSTPMPAMATGSIAPPRALTGASGSQWNIDLLNEIKALRSEIYGLASQPVQVSAKTYLDKRQIGESVTEYQRETARANGR